MGAAQLVQLKSMLDRPQEPVRRRKLRSIVASDVTTGSERLERDEGRRAAQRLIAATVHELQELHGELDVTKTTGSELHLAVDLDGGQVVEDPASHRLHVRHETLALRRRPDQWPKCVDVVTTEVRVAGHWPRLEQRLELPGLRPPAVVALVACQRANERAGLAFRP